MSLIDNSRALYDYEILERIEAGIVLSGYEVKALRGHMGKLQGAYVIIRGGEAFLVKSHIPPYQEANVPTDYDSERNRKLLIGRKDIERLVIETENKGLTIIPISMYNKGTKIKVELAIARGKKKEDKRNTIKNRELDREIRREYKVR